MENVIGQEDFDIARRDLLGAQQKMASLNQQLAETVAQLNGDPDIPVEAHPRYMEALAHRDEAARQLDHTAVRAPFAGIVTNVPSITPGRSTALGDSRAEPPFTLALHIGEVLYGNVGGGHRLDFTVIGPAVNLAARLERLGLRTVTTSAEFARMSGSELVPLGSYMLRGITTRQPVFGLPEDDAALEKPVQSLVCER